jgi:hypothetical protein
MAVDVPAHYPSNIRLNIILILVLFLRRVRNCRPGTCSPHPAQGGLRNQVKRLMVRVTNCGQPRLSVLRSRETGDIS